MSNVAIVKCPRCGAWAKKFKVTKEIYRIVCWCGDIYVNEKGEDMSKQVSEEAQKRKEW